jgi:hypothetical protein
LAGKRPLSTLKPVLILPASLNLSHARQFTRRLNTSTPYNDETHRHPLLTTVLVVLSANGKSTAEVPLMRIAHLSIKNFRGIAQAKHAVLIGDNNSGKIVAVDDRRCAV